MRPCDQDFRHWIRSPPAAGLAAQLRGDVALPTLQLRAIGH
eukprot:CAMPEP_0170178266 /NCGR_PEP_ID=MMETSP0040_2-20121228/11774_1 /TAXON_ID=641309 /ORGANISM="Lotharella oceanica, Strain CCMP622" /LENGTH=40 /DNA_ID= /DNA_START= /DNA_END= /DNA_ORIENTATION=